MINTVTDAEITLESARGYEQRRFAGKRRGRRLDRLEKDFAAHLFQRIGPGACVLDIPCGNGRFFPIFSNAKQLTMADYSPHMLQACQERFGKPEQVTYIQADISSIPLSDRCVDLCFCMRLFHHMKNDEVRSSALRELTRVSKKYVALSFYNKNRFRYYKKVIRGKKPRGNYITLTHLKNLAQQAGLRYIEHTPKFNWIEQQCMALFEKV
jgi:ubiquinone/menaquinone biosynthesis C-methylase UbiE